MKGALEEVRLRNWREEEEQEEDQGISSSNSGTQQTLPSPMSTTEQILMVAVEN